MEKFKEKDFEVNEVLWKEAIEAGWNGYFQRINERLLGRGSQFEEAGKWVKKNMPERFNQLYQELMDGLVEHGMDEDHAAEFMEEIIGGMLAEVVVTMGSYFNKNLVMEVD